MRKRTLIARLHCAVRGFGQRVHALVHRLPLPERFADQYGGVHAVGLPHKRLDVRRTAQPVHQALALDPRARFGVQQRGTGAPVVPLRTEKTPRYMRHTTYLANGGEAPRDRTLPGIARLGRAGAWRATAPMRAARGARCSA